MSRNIGFQAVMLSTALFAAGQISKAQTHYAVTSIGVNISPLVNAAGTVAGAIGSNLSYVWSQKSGLIRIPGLVYSYGYGAAAQGINDSGIVVGYDAYAYEAITWDPVNGTQALPGFQGYNSTACGVNDLGHICGFYYDGNTGPIPFLWKPGLGWMPLSLGGGTAGQAFTINIHDQILGGIDFQGDDEGVIWQADGSVTVLGNMLTQTENLAYDINDLGYVCGGTFGPMGHIGYLMDPAGNFTPIYNPVNRTYTTSASGLNNHNVVVGYAGRVPGGGFQGFIWTAKKGFSYLNDVLAPGSTQWDIEEGSSINDNGQIAAIAKLNGTTYAVLLTPVLPTPLPVTHH